MEKVDMWKKHQKNLEKRISAVQDVAYKTKYDRATLEKVWDILFAHGITKERKKTRARTLFLIEDAISLIENVNPKDSAFDLMRDSDEWDCDKIDQSSSQYEESDNKE